MPMFRELETLAPDVFMFPRDDTPDTIQPNIGVLRLKNQTILIDAGNSPRHARQIMAAMAGLDFAPIETIIYTHHHWDHTFGAATFNPSIIIAQTQNADIMANYATRPWGPQHLREEIYRNPRREVSLNAMMDAIPDWREFRISQPTVTFSKTLTLYYAKFTLELEAVGGQHAMDSIIVRIPEAGVMFIGDSYYPMPLHLRDEEDIDLDIAMLESFISPAYHTYVDGHGPQRTRAELEAVIAYEKRRQGMLEG